MSLTFGVNPKSDPAGITVFLDFHLFDISLGEGYEDDRAPADTDWQAGQADNRETCCEDEDPVNWSKRSDDLRIF